MTSTELLQLIKNKIYPELYIFEDKFAPIDSYCFKNNLWIEVKSRRCVDDFYPEIIIEYHKYRKIVGVKKARYIISMENKYGHLKIYSFNFNELSKPEWKLEKRPVYNSRPNSKVEDVHVAYFNTNLAKDITSLLLD